MSLSGPFKLLIIFLVLSGCIQVETGTPKDDEEGGQTSSEVNDEAAQNSNQLASSLPGETVNLIPHVVFQVLNPASKNLDGIFVDLASGENVKTFSTISARLASNTPLLVKLPTNIIDNSIYVFLKGPSGTVREKHFIPQVNCGEGNEGDCNKVIVSIGESKFKELK